MFWIVQDDLFQHNQRSTLLDILERFAIPHQVVQVTAHRKLIPTIEHDGPIITNGSILLSNIANDRGWQPGSLFNDNFSYNRWSEHYRAHLLNRDATVTTIAKADPDLDEFFIRPVLDDKAFTGQTMTQDVFRRWQAMMIERQPEMAILYASVKTIGQEHRHFIVDGRVVSSSRYKLAGNANQTAMVDLYVIAFATRLAAVWQPARAFVMDTYIKGDEIGIVEIGGICHAGFYQADVAKIVMALDAMC